MTGRGEPVGAGWAGFTALASGGDFSGDGKPDVLARAGGGDCCSTGARCERLR